MPNIIYNPTSCDQLNCYPSKSCCIENGGEPFCLVSSQCDNDPVWQSAVIPAVIFFFAVCILAVVIYKLCKKRVSTMQVTNFARK